MRTVFVANRAEIAARVIRTARRLGFRTVAVASQADRDLPFTRLADRTVLLEGSPEVRATYLDPARMVDAAVKAGADAVHPGYGFLSENAAFAEAVEAAGLCWIGPPPAAIRAMGDKARARRVAVAEGVPVVPGFDGSQDPDALARAAADIGFPVLIKATAGGGGRGMRRVDDPAAFAEALASAKREALSAFGDEAVIVEKYVTRPRHVEVQIVADRHGNVIHLGERECSVQRRHQKVVEEAPSPGVDAPLRARMGADAVRVAKAVGYVGAGTVEFVLGRDESTGGSGPGLYGFLEMNTRLQVEHPVTEEVTGLDLVELQLRIAAGEPLPIRQEDVTLRGHAIEVRLYAEDPLRGWLPATGRLHRFDLPGDVRIEPGFAAGDEVSPYYDAMLAKLVASGPDRATATCRLLRAVEEAWAPGVVTNLPLLRQTLAHPLWAAADLDTAFFQRAGLPVAPPLNLDRGALAALALGRWERREAFPGRPAWRVYGTAAQTDRFRCGEAVITVTWTGDRVTVDGVEHGLVVLDRDGDRLRIELDGVVQTWRVARVPASPTHASLDDGDLVYAHFGDGEAFVQLEPRFPVRAAAVEPGSCTAPTPGRVSVVHVKPGDPVQGGARLVTLEAMKMEHAVVAPGDGVVAEVRVEPGQQVDEGDLLVRLQTVKD